MAHGAPSSHCTYHGSRAIRMKISSPAYMLPNNRRASEIGLAISSINWNRKLIGPTFGPNGAENSSCM